mmetsp:Transcript_12146/g.28765  ORF Transcript_12146/g.28765 Transcript_12146/m.28765 type:complete len:381 (-) Transcript_12146:76-1218(-)
MVFSCCSQPTFVDGKEYVRATKPKRNSRVAKWWEEKVSFGFMEECPSRMKNTDKLHHFCRRLKNGSLRFVRISSTQISEPADSLQEKLLNGVITSYTEYRLPLFGMPTFAGFPFYHTYAVLEVDDGDFQILLERLGDNMEMMVGEGFVCRELINEFRSNGQARVMTKVSAELTRKLQNKVSVRSLITWMGSSLASRWNEYGLFFNNCQHFQVELEIFLFDKSRDLEPPRAQGICKDRQLAMDSLKEDGLRLKYFPKLMRDDADLVLVAVQQNGQALAYASKKMQENVQVVIAAAVQSPSALQYASPDLRNNRSVAMRLVTHNGMTLAFLPEQLRRDRDIYMAAIAESCAAARYIPADLRADWQVLLQLASKDISSVQYLF